MSLPAKRLERFRFQKDRLRKQGFQRRQRPSEQVLAQLQNAEPPPHESSAAKALIAPAGRREADSMMDRTDAAQAREARARAPCARSKIFICQLPPVKARAPVPYVPRLSGADHRSPRRTAERMSAEPISRTSEAHFLRSFGRIPAASH